MATTLTFNPITGQFDAVLVATATVQTFLATPSSSNLAAAVTDETGSGALVFATSPTFTTTATVTRSALAAVSTDGIVLQNETASTAGVPVQMSPRLTLKGRAWNSTGSADETESFFIENLPATAAGTITGTMKIGYRNNAGTVTYPLTLTSTGDASIANTVDTFSYTANGSGSYIFGGRSRSTSPANGQLNVTNNAATAGVGLDVTTDATLKIRTRAQTGDASVTAGAINSSGTVTAATSFVVGNITAASSGALTGTTLNSITYGSTFDYNQGNGLFRFLNNGGSAGAGINVTTNGTLLIRNQAQSADGQLAAASVRGNAVAFASVPATPVEGMLVAITDSATATWGATITGGGANHVLGYYNGTNWTVAGK